MPLSEVFVKKIKPKDKRYLKADEGGLYIEVYTNGTKAWRFRHKNIKISLGTYPEITLAEARNLCEEMRRKVARDEPLKEEIIPTFAEVAKEWLDNRMRPDKTADYIESIEQKLRDYVLPAIGDAQITKIHPSVVLEMCRGVEARGYIETAKKCLQIVRQVYRYAVVAGKSENNPTSFLSEALKTQKAKHFAALTEPEDVTRLVRSIYAYPSVIVRAALLFSLFTFLRPTEVRHAEWSEINWENRELHIPAKKMKGKKSHIVPLATQVIELLKELKQITGNQRWLFPSVRKNGNPMSEATVLIALRIMGFGQEEACAHGFRATAKSTLSGSTIQKNGFPRDHIEMQLAHSRRNKLEDAYNRANYLSERHEMMQAYADWIVSLLRS